MLTMLILMMTKSKKELAHKFQCTCCGSFQIHLPVIVYHSANTDHNTYLGLYSKIFPDPFCLFIVRICDAYYCQIVVEFFLDWQWHFIESLPTIHVLRWERTFYKHPTNVFNVFIGKRFQIFLLSLHHIFSHNFLHIWISRVIVDCYIFRTRLDIFAFAFVESFGKIIS